MEQKSIFAIPDNILADYEKILLLKLTYLQNLEVKGKLTIKDIATYLGWEPRKVIRILRCLKIKKILEPIPNSLSDDLIFNYKINYNQLEIYYNSTNIVLPQYETLAEKIRRKVTKKDNNLVNPDKEPLVLKPTRNTRIMIKYWNSFPCLSPIKEVEQGSILQSKQNSKTLENCSRFLAGKLFHQVYSYFPENCEPVKTPMTVDDFKLFVSRFVTIITDADLEPINKNTIRTHNKLNTFLVGNEYAGIKSFLLSYCLHEPEPAMKFKNPKKDVLILRDKWKQFNPSFVFNGKDLKELDKFISYAMIIIKGNKRFKPIMGSVTSKLGDVVNKTIEKSWGKGKIQTLRPTYLNTNHFKGAFESMLKKLGY